MAENQEEFNKRAERIMAEVQAILDREKVTFVAQLNFSPNGIIPSIAMVNAPEKKPAGGIQVIKNKFLV